MLNHLYEILVQRAQRFPAAIAIGGQQDLGWRTLDSRELVAAVERLAAEIAATLGVGDGDRVVVWLPNGWRTPVYLFALWRLGAVVVPFDREMNSDAAERILASVAPRAILAGYGERPDWARCGVTEWWEPGARATPRALAQWTRPAETLAALFFTSGTTGNPKGCMITHANLCFEVEALPEKIPLGPDCRLASILPLSHLYEMTAGLLYPLSQGAAIHYVPSRRGPDILRVFNEQRITHMIAVPQLLAIMGQVLEGQLRSSLPAPVFKAFMRTAERLPPGARRALFFMVHRRLGGHLRMLASGGAALAPETQRLWERLGLRVVQGYGTSECSPIVACSAPDGSTPIGSVGRPLRGVEVKLGTDGELLVKGPIVMSGYWQDAARTAEVLDAEGWYTTGDLANIDADGNIHLSGRARELIVLPSGMNVWPGDVEDALRTHPSVQDAAVLLAPNASGGATLHAYLVPRDGRGADAASVVAEVNGRLAQHQRVATASWWMEPDFPRTSTLKVKRHLLPVPDGQLGAMRVDSVLAADDPVGQAIAGAARVPGVQPAQTLAALGLDSLGLVDLALALEEKTGRVVGDGDLKLEMSVAEVRSLISAAPAVDESAEASSRFVPPLWPYTWGRAFRSIAFPLDLVYRYGVTRTTVLGGERLARLPQRGVIFAGTHRSFADVSLVRVGLGQTPARRFASRLVIAAGSEGAGWKSIWGKYAILALGLFPLEQTRGRDASLRALARVAAAGNAILIFPQGMHTLPEQEQGDPPAVRFRPGVAHLARALSSVVVPFGLAGPEQRIPAVVEGFRGPVVAGIPVSISRGPLAIAFGEPLTPGADELPRDFAERLEVICYALSRQAEAALGG